MTLNNLLPSSTVSPTLPGARGEGAGSPELPAHRPGGASETPVQCFLRGCAGAKRCQGGRGGKALRNSGPKRTAASAPLRLYRGAPNLLPAFWAACMCFQCPGKWTRRPRALAWLDGYPPPGIVLEGAVSFQASLEDHLHLHCWLTKGKVYPEIPGLVILVLRLFVSFPATFMRSSLCTLQPEQTSTAMETADTRQFWPLHLAAQPGEITAFVVVCWLLLLGQLCSQALTRDMLTWHHEPLL